MKKGFTLIESLVAISILTITVTALMFSANRAIIAAQNSRNQLIASHLAQEGIEYVRMMRDNEYLANGTVTGWSNFTTKNSSIYPFSISDCKASANKICALNDPTNNDGSSQLRQCTVTNASCIATFSLYRSLSSGIYTSPFTPPSDAIRTPFYRSIQAECLGGVCTTSSVTATEVRIVSEVWWDFRGTRYSVTISENLTRWQ